MTASLGYFFIECSLEGSWLAPGYQKVVDNPKYISFLCIHASHHLWELWGGWGAAGMSLSFPAPPSVSPAHFLLTAHSEPIYIWLSDERQENSHVTHPYYLPFTWRCHRTATHGYLVTFCTACTSLEHACYQAFRFSWLEGINERYSETHLSLVPMPSGLLQSLQQTRIQLCREPLSSRL